MYKILHRNCHYGEFETEQEADAFLVARGWLSDRNGIRTVYTLKVANRDPFVARIDYIHEIRDISELPAQATAESR